MATIAGVTVPAFHLPEEDIAQLNVTRGKSQSGSMMIREFRASDKVFSITMTKVSDSTKASLKTALLAAVTTTVVVDPDAHIDLGNGAGTAVNAYWLDPAWRTPKQNHDAWDITLTFQYSS
jgi:predicted deacylase